VISSCRVDVCHDVDPQTLFFLAEISYRKDNFDCLRYQIDDFSTAASIA
jgi:hypothetical protein